MTKLDFQSCHTQRCGVYIPDDTTNLNCDPFMVEQVTQSGIGHITETTLRLHQANSKVRQHFCRVLFSLV